LSNGGGLLRIGGQSKQGAFLRAAMAAGLFALADPAVPQENSVKSGPAVNEEGLLRIRRNATESELRELAKSLAESRDRTKTLQAGLIGIERTSAGLRQALVASAEKRKSLEKQTLEDEAKLRDLEAKLAKVKASLHDRRGLLAEVLAALQRMGRNPPPALLVSPDDALSSVRSAILLGAVVPGVRHETDRLAADLKSLTDLSVALTAQRQTYVTTMASAIEEEQRMNALLDENAKLSAKNKGDLERENQRVEQLAARATSLENLIASLERSISSARQAADAARASDRNMAALTPAERTRLQEEAGAVLPDKNRIAPAYPFSVLKAKLELPVAGEIIRRVGDDDGTGHPAQGLTVAAGPGLVVTAPADGWVMFAGPFRSYGEMVIMNAGENYHILLSGMDKVSVRQGQFVVSGEPVGQMGAKRIASATGLNLETDRPTLYIEFRKDGKPVDSRPWWSVKELGKARNDT
jgi:septal ring factor EnvC (AmiA/AmiB activator)